MARITIQLREESITALRTLARQEYRDVRKEAAWIIERELERRGLLILHPQFAALTMLSTEDTAQEGGYVTG